MARKADRDKPILWMERRPQGLVPATPLDLEELERYRIGTRLHVTIEQPTDDSLMRFYRAVVSKAAKAIGQDPDSLHWWLRIECGLWREVVIFDGSSSIQPLSLKEIPDARFREYVDRAIEVITTRVVPGADVEDLLNDVHRHIGEPTL